MPLTGQWGAKVSLGELGMDILIIGAIVVVIVLLARAVWKRGGPHSEEPPERR